MRNAIGMYALETITNGEEITICYNNSYNYMPTAMWRKHQYFHYQFVCNCAAYQTNSPFGELSNMQRHLLHGLFWLSLGAEGVPGRDDKSTMSMTTVWLSMAALLMYVEVLFGQFQAELWYQASFSLSMPKKWTFLSPERISRDKESCWVMPGQAPWRRFGLVR